MLRLCTPLGLLLASSLIGGCTNARPVDTAQWRLYRPGMETVTPRRVKAASRRSAPVVARDADDAVETTGTIAQSRALRPWPRVGTPEWFEIQAQDAERERRVQEAIRNVCRGC